MEKGDLRKYEAWLTGRITMLEAQKPLNKFDHGYIQGLNAALVEFQKRIDL